MTVKGDMAVPRYTRHYRNEVLAVLRTRWEKSCGKMALKGV